ncbi:hypothetical protein KUV64_13925 [Mameliella alba]|uniref:hypothetical protein n=1 Tax=Mameliella TaxID=1434019 RepID=UPI001C96BE91|nr:MULTISPECIES: hypothetical protein [Mameliella]MBY6120231.1 hypothetical protein [Mameliella alba]MDD9733134.1 hypothetical protein [Mameliella sp. AT18]
MMHPAIDALLSGLLTVFIPAALAATFILAAHWRHLPNGWRLVGGWGALWLWAVIVVIAFVKWGTA